MPSQKQPGLTGHAFEKAVIGTCLGSKPWSLNAKKLSFERAMEWVQTHQPAMTSYSARIHDAVRRYLEHSQFYTAAGSSLDYHWGIDAYIMWKGVMVSLDLTLNPHKDNKRADMIVRLTNVQDAQAIDRLAQHIAQIAQLKWQRCRR